MSWQISPFGNNQFFNSNGQLAVGVKLFTYLAGTATKEAVATDAGGAAFHTNPIVLNAIGMPPSPIFIDVSKSYKFVYAPSTDSDPPLSPIYTADGITVKDLTSVLSEWVLGTTPTYVGADQFSVAGDQRSTYHVGRRVKLVASGSTVYGVISLSVFTSVTTVTVLVDDGLTISASLNTVYYSLLSAAGSSWPVGFNSGLKTTFTAIDNRTDTISLPVEVISQTTGTPAVGIGIGMRFRAESADEAPSDAGQIDFTYSDVGAGVEDTYFQILLRVAGNALTACYRFISNTLFKAIFTHDNTADRTYTLPNFSTVFGIPHDSPRSVGAGSTRSHEGTVVISSNQTISGTHFYTDFTIDAGVVVSVAAGSRSLIIYASNSIVINGTITTVGGGPLGGTAGNPGNPGSDQPGGNGNGGANQGGRVLVNGCDLGVNAPTSITGSSNPLIGAPFTAVGGGSGAGGSTGQGGRGGGSIVLIAPSVTLGGAAVLNTSGSNGGSANAGGGGAGNIYILTHSFTDDGATFTQNGGSPNGTGGAGSDGIVQIDIY